MGLETVESQYLEGRSVLNCADQTAAGVDRVVMEMLKESYEKAKALLRANRIALDRIAAFLIEKETITGKEFMKILHEIQEDTRRAESFLDTSDPGPVPDDWEEGPLPM